MEYTLRISKVVENKEYIEPKDWHSRFHDERSVNPKWIEKDTTVVTLDEDQFRKVQMAIVNALK